MANLERFIREHRNEGDVFTPSPKVWNGIESGMKNPTFIKSTLSWLKYAGFSASAIAALVYLYMRTPADRNPDHQISQNTETTHSFSAANTDTIKQNPDPAPTPEIRVLGDNKTWSQVPAATEPEKTDSAIALAPPAASGSLAPLTRPSPAALQNPETGGWTASRDSLKIDTLFTGVKTLEIDCDRFDVNVSSAPGDKVIFKATRFLKIRGLAVSKERCEIKYERKDSVLKITEEDLSKGVFIAGGIKELAIMNFEVPASTRLVLHNKYGDVKAAGLNTSLCDIQVKFGDVRVNNLTSPDLKLGLNYGTLHADTISGNLTAKIAMGDLLVTGMNGSLNTESSYGDQKYKDVTGTLKARASSGDIRITGMKGNAEVHSSYGDITLENYKGSPILNTKSGDIKGKAVELTESMDAESNYGDIKMNLLNNLESLSFDLEAKYGTISVDKDGQKIEEANKLTLKKGSILIKGHTSSGDQSYH